MADPLIIDDLRGGISDEHPAKIGIKQVVWAWNVDYWKSRLGGRRNGASAKVSGLAGTFIGLFAHTPTTDADDNELWAITTGGAWTSYDTAYSGTDITPDPADVFLPTSGVQAATLHGKLFIACKTTDSGAVAVSRMHVWDGTTLRRTGLAEPAVPSVADQGSGSLGATERMYRVRYIEKSGTAVLRRSEPSPDVTITPSGSGASVRVTKPAAIDEGETHWETEISVDSGGNWYLIATTAVGTTTYDDSLATTSVATTGTLSSDIGDYLNLPSAEHVVVDNDRLVYAGNYEDSQLSARLGWTPVSGATGSGNDERAPLDVSSYIDVDGLASGAVTGLAAWEGKLFVFKANSIHTFVRTGSASSAYIPGLVLSRKHGALKGSIVEGLDSEHRTALYFLDPDLGPSSYSALGLRVPITPWLSREWKNINQSASVRVCHTVYHSEKHQVWWHVAVGDTSFPNRRWVLDTDTGGVTFQTLESGGMYASVIWDGKPHIATFDAIIQCDDENETTDVGESFQAYIRTGALQPGSLLRKAAIECAVLEADPVDNTSVVVKLIRDYGIESRSITVNMAPTTEETTGAVETIIRPIDNAYISEAMAIQFEIGDTAEVDVAPWQLQQLVCRWKIEARSA